jgi:hypothetical protein
MSEKLKKRREAAKKAVDHVASGKEKMGWFALGVVTDYFLFKPVRWISPAVVATIGFTIGLLYDRFIIDTILAAIRALGN